MVEGVAVNVAVGIRYTVRSIKRSLVYTALYAVIVYLVLLLGPTTEDPDVARFCPSAALRTPSTSPPADHETVAVCPSMIAVGESDILNEGCS
jgi:hypothetical protein